MVAVSIAGTSLHSLLGIHHGSDHCATACPASFASGARLAAVGRANAGDDGVCGEANCPVCNYLAQGQMACKYAQVVVSSLSVDNGDVPLRVSVPAADFPVFDARGPPAA
jgi:hypothetical protein